MATVSFQLKRPDSKTKTAINAILRDGPGRRFVITTGISVKPTHLLKNKTISSSHSKAATYNSKLRKLESDLIEVCIQANKEGRIASKNEIREYVLPKKDKTIQDFWEVWEEYKAIKKSELKYETFKKFRAIESHLKLFKGGLELDQINKAKVEDLHRFFKEVGYSDSTSGKNVKFLKSFFHYCYDRGLIADDSFKRYIVRAGTEKVKVVLSQAELKKIKSLKLEKKYLNNVRDLLILGCRTGLRHGDLVRISREHYKIIDEQPVITIHQEKTKESVTIPLTDESESIVLGLLSGKVYPISNQKENDYLKELCKLAKINEPIEVGVNQVRLKYELIGTHTGRRTFATNLVQKGIPANVAMKYTGHKTIASFMKYIVIDADETINDIRNALDS
jgi:site-specific recombinase XerD